MKDQSSYKSYSDRAASTSKSKPSICGTLLIWEAERRQKQEQQRKLQKSSEKELSGSKQVDPTDTQKSR